MEQIRAINALEPFLALSKSATSPRAAADLITQATSHPNTYVFAELLHTPNIHALRGNAEYAPYYSLLEIFSWGTLNDYNCSFLPRCHLGSQDRLI
jgi:COP9 signalosome complex subunit 7